MVAGGLKRSERRIGPPPALGSLQSVRQVVARPPWVRTKRPAMAASGTAGLRR